MPPTRIYVETSVWSHWFADDAPERQEETRAFLRRCQRTGPVVELFVSSLVVEELSASPPEKAARLLGLVEQYGPSILSPGEGVEQLSTAYARLGAIPGSKVSDAFHAAIATVRGMDALVSWNYRHLVSMVRRQKINAVNAMMGYNKALEILAPPEVFADAR